MEMVKNCKNCGVFLSTSKPGVTIIEVSEDYRKTRPDVPRHVYLCSKEQCSKQIEEFKTYPWYAGHEVVN